MRNAGPCSWWAVVADALVIGLCWFLACLFGQAALYKLRALEFYRQLMRHYLGEPPLGGAIPLLLAAVEGTAALALLLPPARRCGLFAVAALLLAYALLMAVQLLRGRAGMQCGCAGPDSALGISWALVLRNGLCAGLAVLAAGYPAGALPASWGGLAGALLVAGVALLAYHTSELLIGNAQWMDGEA